MNGDATELRALLTLHFTPGLGARRAAALLAHFGSARAVLAASPLELGMTAGLGERVIAALRAPEAAARADAELNRCERAGVALLGRDLPGYPAALAALHDPPPVLWLKVPGGAEPSWPTLDAVPRAVAVVGTRRPSAYGLRMAAQLARELALGGVTVVSGMARGIDGAAHRAALDAGGDSVAVLGCGADVVYPAEHRALASGLFRVSEYPLGTRPAPYRFPERNRIIAALSAGVVVVEGEEGSGSLLTAREALDCGRTVFAVPGRAGDPLARGPHSLLREGAVLTESAADVLAELGLDAPPAAPPPELPPEQAAVYAALAEPLTLDDLALRTGLPSGELQLALTLLQLAGLAEEGGGRHWRV